MTDLREVGFPYGVTKLQLSDLLGMKYPGFAWEKVFLLRGKYAQQNRLEKSLTSLFPVTKPPLSHTRKTLSNANHRRKRLLETHAKKQDW